AGAIAQEANPQTWDILLTTPLNSMQITLGNLFGRLFFVLALLFSSLPLFAMTQFFGGVPSASVVSSYLIAACSALIVAAIAVTLSVTRTAGRRAVFFFYISVVMYLFVSYALDSQFLRPMNPVGAGGNAYLTTVLTPLNPFLALEVLLKSNSYVPHDFAGESVGWITRMWLGRPIATFCWITSIISFSLILFATLRLRVIGTSAGVIPWYRRIVGLRAKGATERTPRTVWNNAVAWRECAGRSNTLIARLGRWGFLAAGLLVGLILLVFQHTSNGKIGSWNAATLQSALCPILLAEIVVIALVALNMSASAVSREREDGSLDIILTTPIQPGPYLAGKLRGLIQFLLPMMLVPAGTVLMMAVYAATDGLGHDNVTVMSALMGSSGTVTLPFILPEAAITLPIVLVPFIALCVMVGMLWSIKSKGSIGAVIAAVGAVIISFGLVSGCASLLATQRGLGIIGAFFSAFSPVNLVVSSVYPTSGMGGAIESSAAPARTALFIGALAAGATFSSIVYVLHNSMKRSFMMTVRKLAGSA
ncbi:MAG TPA: hypothetical protein VG711_08820, partial [Phycisphaerales bacterium]|nr:hypothetical protein [Phycisphaerales bacterium]